MNKFICLYLQTALHISAHIGCSKNIQTLLNHNANLLLQDSNGLTALDIVLNAENTECIKLLKNASGNLNKFVFLNNILYIINYYKSQVLSVFEYILYICLT